MKSYIQENKHIRKRYNGNKTGIPLLNAVIVVDVLSHLFLSLVFPSLFSSPVNNSSREKREPLLRYFASLLLLVLDGLVVEVLHCQKEKLCIITYHYYYRYYYYHI